MKYQMCPECYAVFIPTEIDKQIAVGLHVDTCSKPKIEWYEEEMDKVIEKLEKEKEHQKKWKT